MRELRKLLRELRKLAEERLADPQWQFTAPKGEEIALREMIRLIGWALEELRGNRVTHEARRLIRQIMIIAGERGLYDSDE